MLEDEAVRRAVEGCKKAIFYQGKVVGYETEYSDQLMLLRASSIHNGYAPFRWPGPGFDCLTV